MADLTKTIHIRNTKDNRETTMLLERWKLRHQRLQREGWVVVDPEQLGIEVVAPPKTIEEKVKQAQKDMGVEAKEPTPPTADNGNDEVIEEIAVGETRSFEDMDVKELKDYARSVDVKFPKNANKAKMIELLTQ